MRYNWPFGTQYSTICLSKIIFEIAEELQRIYTCAFIKIFSSKKDQFLKELILFNCRFTHKGRATLYFALSYLIISLFSLDFTNMGKNDLDNHELC